ncbi:alpha/beta fold hydrolase, partial [Pseudomonas sp. MAFF212428]|nr:alpha/beta fold hydrolase [Pseudomonas brassicae]
MIATASPSTAPVVCTPVQLRARDGYPLSARRYQPAAGARANVLVAGATGVQQRFYRPFAHYAASKGYNVLTLDYRGIGESRPASLDGFAMSYLDWGRLDLAAAVDLLAQDDLPLYWVGHSHGGQAIGLLPNHAAISACYSLGCGAGWTGWMPTREALKVRALWGAVLPLIVACKGYMAWSLLGMGSDLPMGVYKDWKRWCAYPHYFFDDPAMAYLAENYASVRMPCLFAASEDDLWAPPRSRDAFIKGYCNAPVTTLDIPSRAHGAPMGHMGYFHRSARALWGRVAAVAARARCTSRCAGVCAGAVMQVPRFDRVHRAFRLCDRCALVRWQDQLPRPAARSGSSAPA